MKGGVVKCWEAIGQLCCVFCFDGILRIVGFLLAAAAPGYFSQSHAT